MTWRVFGIVFGMVVLLSVARGEDGASSSRVASSAGRGTSAAKEKVGFTPEREAAARTFVERHHGALLTLLDRLKVSDRAEYEAAMVDLFQVSEGLANLQQGDAERYERNLEVWKARSRVQVLAAQLASRPRPELEGQLRQAIEAQLGAELRQQEHEREVAAARLQKVEKAIDRLKRDHDRLLESRYEVLLKKARRAHRGEARTSRSAPAPRASTMGDDGR